MSLLSLRRAVVRRIPSAEVAELADAHGSGPCTRKGVGVRVPSSAPQEFISTAGRNPYLLPENELESPSRVDDLSVKLKEWRKLTPKARLVFGTSGDRPDNH